MVVASKIGIWRIVTSLYLCLFVGSELFRNQKIKVKYIRLTVRDLD